MRKIPFSFSILNLNITTVERAVFPHKKVKPLFSHVQEEDIISDSDRVSISNIVYTRSAILGLLRGLNAKRGASRCVCWLSDKERNHTILSATPLNAFISPPIKTVTSSALKHFQSLTKHLEEDENSLPNIRPIRRLYNLSSLTMKGSFITKVLPKNEQSVLSFHPRKDLR